MSGAAHESLASLPQAQRAWLQKLRPALLAQARLYANADTDSLPAEQMAELLQSMLFCVALAAGERPLEQLLGLDPATLFKAGQQQSLALVEDAKELYARVLAARIETPSYSFNDTLREIGLFFARYDAYFFAHQIPCMMTYPLAGRAPGSQGIVFIGDYLWRFALENRFLACFGAARRNALLARLIPGYAELPLGLFEPVFYAAAGLFAAGQNAHRLGDVSPGDFARFDAALGALHADEFGDFLSRFYAALGLEVLPSEQRLFLGALRRIQNGIRF